MEEVPHPVVAANGEQLQVLGRTTAKLQIGELQSHFPILIAKGIIQECLLGADFLMHHNCFIDLRNRELVVGGKSVPLQTSAADHETPSCHVRFSETMVIPAWHEVQLPLQLSGTGVERINDHCEGFLKPTPMLFQKHGLLVAHSISQVAQGQVPTRILNPSPLPVTIHKHE